MAQHRDGACIYWDKKRFPIPIESRIRDTCAVTANEVIHVTLLDEYGRVWVADLAREYTLFKLMGLEDVVSLAQGNRSGS